MEKGRKIKIGLEKITIAKLNNLSKSNIIGGSVVDHDETGVTNINFCNSRTIEPESVNNDCPNFM